MTPSDKICVAEFDDYPIHAERMIKQTDMWHNMNPRFKATLYGIPLLMKDEHFKMVYDRPWLRLGVHGFQHRRAECRRRHTGWMMKVMDMVDKQPYDKICKPPFYGYGKRYIELMHNRGYAMSCRHANDIYRWIDPINCPSVRMYCKHEQPFIRMFGHPKNTPFMFTRQMKEENKKVLLEATDFLFSTDVVAVREKIYLGSGEHQIPGFHNFDKDAKGASKWEWGNALPYGDSSISVILTQHSLMYADLHKYLYICQEMYRVLCTGGRVIVKEDNPDKYVWKPVGRCGVRSLCHKSAVREAMEKAGLTMINDNGLQLVDKYVHLFNRTRRVRSDMAYIMEFEKKGGRR